MESNVEGDFMTTLNEKEYDFIVVGAGASGCTVALRLANSRRKPTVLLVEAGGANDALTLRADGDRWISRLNPAMTWGYQTEPQKHLKNRCISYDRGKGLGGSTAINFCVFNTGPSGDWDEIARIVDDDEFSWQKASQRFVRLETYHANPSELPAYAQKYLSPNPRHHGQNGPLQIGFPRSWEPIVPAMLDICKDAGLPINPDMNSGNPIGVGIAPNSAYKGVRTTAADMLESAPPNLELLLAHQVTKVLFEHKRAVGIALGGKTIHARKEVILSCGSLDTPKLLMLSGIGPLRHLNEHGISAIVELAGIGQNLQDHHHVFITWERAEHTTGRRAYYRSQERQAAARVQWEKDQTGPLADIGTTLALGWLKSEAIWASEEFAALSGERRQHLLHPTVPTHEYAFNPGNAEYFIDPENAPALFSTGIFILNPASVGSVRLQSANADSAALFDPNFLDHEYDRRVAIESTRELLRLAKNPDFARDTVRMISGPENDSEEAILEYWRNANMSTWHMACTCKMGKPGTDGACVDSKFCVFGTSKLRVVDMSVVPILPNCHTQGMAYCLGLTAADKIVGEYKLDEW